LNNLQTNEFNFENSQEGHRDGNCHPQIGSKFKPRVSKSYANLSILPLWTKEKNYHNMPNFAHITNPSIGA
jgi:hypothetical protein